MSINADTIEFAARHEKMPTDLMDGQTDCFSVYSRRKMLT